ncbi:hypothetical protein ACIRN4_01380 [Pimelobacter simplex]|uniref:hypothetical protein n=1 Tax=Nocardioides simplex TaxID=2045 RepID=UPI0038143117
MSDPSQPYGAPPPPPGPPGPPPPPLGPPPVGPPPFPPPPPGPPGTGGTGTGKGKGLWIALGVVGVLALVGVVVALVLVLTGGDDDGDDDTGSSDDPTSSARSPEDVVDDVLDAAEEGDCAAVEKLLTETARSARPCESDEFQLLAGDGVDSDVGTASIDGSTATVPVDFTSSQGSTEYLFTLEQVDGAWRVASYYAGRSTSSGTIVPSPPASSGTPSATGTPGATGTGTPSGTSTASAVPNEPAAVVEAFLDSAFAGDCATAEELVTEAYVKANGRCANDTIPTQLGDEVTYDVGQPTVDQARGTAKVPVEITAYGKSQDSVVSLVQEDGRWLIDRAG